MVQVRQIGIGMVLLLFLGVFAPSAAAQTETPNGSAALEQEFQAAVAAQDAGDFDKAETMLLSLRARHPGIFAVDESLGLVYVAQDKYFEALPVLEAAAREAPDSDVAQANLGAAYYKLHRNAEALKALEAAARLNPRNFATQEALGRLHMEMHEPARAADAFASAIALKPGDGDLMVAHAQALMDAGQFAQAREQLGAIPDSVQSAAAQSLLGDVEEKAGNIRSAAEHNARAVELEPSEQNVWTLGLEFLRHWTFEPAIKEFEAATVKFPESARMKLGLGVAAFGNGDFKRAIQIFSDLLAVDSNNALYAQLLGVACTTVAEGEQPQCGILISYSLAHPKDANTAVHAAAWIEKQAHTTERLATERKLLENALAADPKLAEAQYRMGLLQQDEGQWEPSIPHLEAAVKLNDELAEAHYRLGQAYWHAGRKSEAETQMELYRKHRAKKMEDRDHRLSQITTLVVNMQN
jgi:tetratricopeptide (TPR) repeat protein